MDLYALLVECAKKEGFPLAGALDLDLSEGDSQHSIQPHIRHYDEWLARGYSGAMEYLVRGRDRRADPRLLFPEAQSILCVAFPYPKRPAGSTSPARGPRYARYLQGDDYHIDIAARLDRAMRRVQTQWESGNGSSPLRWKVCVDTSAVLERSWAALAGLGWIGKNTLLIHPQLGSYLFLGEVLINQRVHRGPNPLPNYCGNCTRCLTACPTQAIEEPHRLNSNRCVSYLTLEKRGELTQTSDEKLKFGPWIAGCDICQEVCPFNTKPVKVEGNTWNSDPLPPNATSLQEWIHLLDEDLLSYKTRVQRSAMKRIKPPQFSRNLAIALANSLPMIQRQDPSLLPEISQRIHSRLMGETDEAALSEWRRCQQVLSELLSS